MLGNLQLNQIYNMDCLEGMKMIPDKSISMILTDLPYGVTARNEWDTIIPFEPLWEQYERIIKDDGAIVLTATQPFAAALIMSDPKLFRYDWIWEKTNATGHLNAKKMPMRAHESILVFYKKLPVYNPQKTAGHKRKVSKAEHQTDSRMSLNQNAGYKPKTYDSTERYPRSIQVFASDKQKVKLHNTQKPVALCEYLIKTYTNENDLVLDSCMGSGTTAVACVNTNRNFIGFEIESEFAEKANNRIAAVLNKRDAI